MRDLIEGLGYYLSCMMLFNGIYSVKIIADGNVHVKPCNSGEWAITLTCSIATLLVILGAAFTFKILGVDGYAIQICSLYAADGRQRGVSAKYIPANA